jgi:hypothetical protein
MPYLKLSESTYLIFNLYYILDEILQGNHISFLGNSFNSWYIHFVHNSTCSNSVRTMPCIDSKCQNAGNMKKPSVCLLIK